MPFCSRHTAFEPQGFGSHGVICSLTTRSGCGHEIVLGRGGTKKREQKMLFFNENSKDHMPTTHTEVISEVL